MNRKNNILNGNYKISRSLAVIIAAIMIIFTFSITACSNSEQTSEAAKTEQGGISDQTSESATDSDEEKAVIKAVASFYPMFDFAARIGGSRVDLTNLVPSGVEPHSWEPSAGDIIKLETADVFIYNGAGMEHWVDTVLSAVSNENLIVVETAADLELRKGHSHDHESENDNESNHGPDEDLHEEDIHEDDVHEELSPEEDSHDNGDNDPHTWLDPMLAIEQMRAIRDALVEADPEGADYYQQNFETASAEFAALDQEFHERLHNLASRDLIVTHEAYGYLSAAYDLNQIAIYGISPEDEPSPARMAEIIELAKERQIRVIFFEELVSPKVAQTIADAVSAETAVLSTLGGLTDEQTAAGDDYLSVMRLNLDTIEYYLSDRE